MNKYTLDRFESGFAVLIAATSNVTTPLNIPREEIPRNAKEGDTLFFEDNRWAVDFEDTAARKAKIQSRFNKLKKKNLPKRQESE